MSHINAREEPEVAFLKGGSRFLATKYQGELAVMAEFPEATIFRYVYVLKSINCNELPKKGALMFTESQTASSTTGSPSGGNLRPLDLTSACLERWGS